MQIKSRSIRIGTSCSSSTRLLSTAPKKRPDGWTYYLSLLQNEVSYRIQRKSRERTLCIHFRMAFLVAGNATGHTNEHFLGVPHELGTDFAISRHMNCIRPEAMTKMGLWKAIAFPGFSKDLPQWRRTFVASFECSYWKQSSGENPFFSGLVQIHWETLERHWLQVWLGRWPSPLCTLLLALLRMSWSSHDISERHAPLLALLHSLKLSFWAWQCQKFAHLSTPYGILSRTSWIERPQS